MTTGRAKAAPRFISSSLLIHRSAITPQVTIGTSSPKSIPLVIKGCQSIHSNPSNHSQSSSPNLSSKIHLLTPSKIPPNPKIRILPLHVLCIARSGDKGNTANIALISRHPSFYPLLLSSLTPSLIRQCLSHVIEKEGVIQRYEVPGIWAVNFVVTKCLGGGGLGSLYLDRQGKGFAQVVLSSLGVEIEEGDGVVVERARL